MTTISSPASQTPAILGGPKAVRGKFPRWPEFDQTDRDSVMAALDSGVWWMYGHPDVKLSTVEQFERKLAEAHKVRHAIAVTSGSMALEICMRAIGLQPGDEVITTPYTFFATSGCILNHYALPVYVDIDPTTYNLDPRQVEAAITDRTRAIMPVHFGGDIADMDAINAIARRHNLRVIEDAAQAQSSSLKTERYSGSFGDAAIFSFQASKALNCGEGGAILTNSDEMAELAWSLRNYGRKKDGQWYEHYRTGWNGRLSEISGALLLSQLPRLEDQTRRKMKNAAYFIDQLTGTGLTPMRPIPQTEKRNHHLVLLRYDPSAWDGLPRAKFVAAIRAEGVEIGEGYLCPSYENEVFRAMDMSSARSPFMLGRSKPIDYTSFRDTCPAASRACREEALFLPQAAFLGTCEQPDWILDAIRKLRANIGRLK